MPVSEMVNLSKRHLRRLWQTRIWVSGEIAGVKRYSSGHMYLTLKDDKAAVNCIMYSSYVDQLAKLPADGEAVVAYGEPTIYTPRGNFQLIIQQLRYQGRGALYEDFLRTKERLRNQGWFDEQDKRLIPAFPACIGVVVSEQGAAWRDVRKTLSQRFPAARIKLFPAPAQGDGAAALIAAAIAAAGEHGCDVLIVCRGGGSFEDLQSYNEEVVAAAIRAASMPVITGIGHESDETIADYVADQRCATPTAAAVAAVPDRLEALERCLQLRRRLADSVRQSLNESRQRADDHTADIVGIAQNLTRESRWDIERLSERLDTEMRQRIGRHRHSLDAATSKLRTRMELLAGSSRLLAQLASRLQSCARRMLDGKAAQLRTLGSRLQSHNPRRTLARGFAIVSDGQGGIASKASQLQPGDKIAIAFADGSVAADIDKRVPDALGILDDS